MLDVYELAGISDNSIENKNLESDLEKLLASESDEEENCRHPTSC